MSLLRLNNVSVTFGNTKVLDNISFDVSSNDWLMLTGPNGAGKSTVINAVSGAADYTGNILIGNTDRRSVKPRKMAKKIGVLSQNHSVGYSFTVRDLVSLGRYPYRNGLLAAKSTEDKEKVEKAIEDVGLAEFSDRSLLTLSGGELQRAFIAQLFAQDPAVLLLDEPTNNLDLVYQKEIFELLENWVKNGERAIISVVHDLGLARAYGTKAILLDRGNTVAYGDIDSVFSPDNINKSYRLDINDWMKKLYSYWTEDNDR